MQACSSQTHSLVCRDSPEIPLQEAESFSSWRRHRTPLRRSWRNEFFRALQTPHALPYLQGRVGNPASGGRKFFLLTYTQEGVASQFAQPGECVRPCRPQTRSSVCREFESERCFPFPLRLLALYAMRLLPALFTTHKEPVFSHTSQRRNFIFMLFRFKNQCLVKTERNHLGNYAACFLVKTEVLYVCDMST